MSGLTLDAGALIALDRDDRQVLGLLARTYVSGSRVTIPAGALAQSVRLPQRQARLARLLRQPTTDVIALDQRDAIAVGRMLARSGTTDVIDAHVAICARRADQSVATSDGDDLARLDPALQLVRI
ncbi:hypothetical protein BH10ACT2_BH10ACT2_13390 [soil metagenome]